MMRREPRRQPKLFYAMIDIEERIPANHLLRQVKKTIDFDFIYSEVASTYGHNGNPSVPPSVILKMMVLLVLYNVRSERELMQTIPLRLDWLWFLGYDLDAEIPHHSVLSKARNRWGAAAFQSFFERTVWRCVEAGLVDGRKIFMDASFVEADASMESLVNARSIKHQLHKSYAEFERRLEESPKPSDEPQRRYQKINGQRVSTTDPDSAIARDGRVKLGYKVHRAVDEANEVVTATRTTAADVHEGHLLSTLLDDHHANSARTAETVVADSGYGTVENLLLCRDRGVRGHIPRTGKGRPEAQRGEGHLRRETVPLRPHPRCLPMPGRSGAEAQGSGSDQRPSRLRRQQGRLRRLQAARAVHTQQRGPDASTPPAARRSRLHAPGSSQHPGQRRPPEATAHDGALLREVEALRLRPGSMATALAGGDPGVPRLRHHQHTNPAPKGVRGAKGQGGTSPSSRPPCRFHSQSASSRGLHRRSSEVGSHGHDPREPTGALGRLLNSTSQKVRATAPNLFGRPAKPARGAVRRLYSRNEFSGDSSTVH